MTERMKAILSTKEMRNFGLTFGVAILAAPGIFCWIFARTYPWRILVPVAGAFVLASLLRPASLRLVHGPWMKFAAAAAWVNTRVILGVFYFLCFTPVAFLVRRSRRPLELGPDGSSSYFIRPGRKNGDMRKTF